MARVSSFEVFPGGGFVVFNRGIFVLLVVFLGFLTSFDFLVSLDFKLGNTSLQRSWGCYAHVGRQVASVSPPSLTLQASFPLPSAYRPAVEEFLFVLAELAEGGQPTCLPGPARLLQLQLVCQGTPAPQ